MLLCRNGGLSTHANYIHLRSSCEGAGLEGLVPTCMVFNLEDKQQLLKDMEDALSIVRRQYATKNGLCNFVEETSLLCRAKTPKLKVAPLSGVKYLDSTVSTTLSAVQNPDELLTYI